MSISSAPPTLVFLRFWRLLAASPLTPVTPIDARFRDEDVGPGRLGGLAEVGIKLLHARVVELIEEQEEVVDAAQSMIPFIVDCALPSIVIDRIEKFYIRSISWFLWRLLKCISTINSPPEVEFISNGTFNNIVFAFSSCTNRWTYSPPFSVVFNSWDWIELCVWVCSLDKLGSILQSKKWYLIAVELKFLTLSRNTEDIQFTQFTYLPPASIVT